MSGPVSNKDAPETTDAPSPPPSPVVEISPGREATVGTTTVRRALPQRSRRTVGPWCFADHFGPAGPRSGPSIGPHPHTGLHTVTWLFEGELVHVDSLGSEQAIRPGQLNLMTAGQGIAHAEDDAVDYDGPMHGVQLWVAQPELTRHGDAAFEHHAELPRAEVGAGVATVLIGDYAGLASSARADTPMVGVDLDLPRGEFELPLREDFEHALVVTQGALRIGSDVVGPGVLAYLGQNRADIGVITDEPTRALLLGGEPFRDRVLMWWNFVARTRDEVELATKDWNGESDRFGTVSSRLARIPAPVPPWQGP